MIHLPPKKALQVGQDLAADPERAYTTILKLASDKNTVNFLREKLRPAAANPLSEKDFRNLIFCLASDNFEIRSKANNQLLKLETDIEADLKKSLTDDLTLETRRRIEKLLESIDTQQRRNRRAIEVLELVNTEAARDVLRTLAKGRTDARLTREAKESLERIANRSGN